MEWYQRSWIILSRSVLVLLLCSQTGCLFTRFQFNRELNPSIAKTTEETKPLTASGKRDSLTPAMKEQKDIQLTGGITESGRVAKLGFSTYELSLKELLDIALQNHPDLAIAQARVQAARGKMIQDGLYPNPQITPNIDNVGDNRNQWGEPGVNIAQEFVTARKLQISREAAAHGVRGADWDAVTRWFEIVTRVRRAYTDLLTAQRQEKTTNEIMKVAQSSLDAANKLLKGGVGSKPDVLRAEVELEQTRVQHEIARRRVAAARKLLAAAVGVPVLPGTDVAGDLDKSFPAYDWLPLQARVLVQSSEVQSAQSKVLQMQQLLQRAEVEKIPNLIVNVNPFYAVPEQDTRVVVSVGGNLPIFNRNQGNVLAAQAQLNTAQAEVKKVELTLTERLANAFKQYQISVEQTEAFRKRILPKARETVELVRTGYQQGDAKYNYTSLLQAQQILFQAELTYVEALGEFWRAVADLEGLFQRPVE